MVIYCSVRFYQEVCELQKNNSYSAIIADVCNYFKDKDISELHITKDIIQSSNKIYSLNKFRINNSLSNKGKSSSYRCICGCFLKNDIVVLGAIYPKTGSEGVDNLSKEEYKNIAGNIKNSIEKNRLYILDVTTQKIILQ